MAEQRRALLPFLQRAEEVQKVEPRIAYYCRLYAVEEGLKLQNRDKAIDELLFSVMDKLESYKSKNTLVPEEDKLQLEGFALKIFDRADRVDRAGRADMSTCKAFYAASVFMEVCTQFGDLDEDLLGKQKYAAWKAADIRKAIREGRKPTVGSGKPHMASSAFHPPLSRFADTLSHVSPPKNAGVLEKNYEAGDKVVCKEGESALPVEGAVLSAMGSTFLVSLPSGTKVSSSEAWAWRTTADRADPKLTLLFNTHSLSLSLSLSQELKGTQLAVLARPGSTVIYTKDGKEEEGKVLSMDTTVWPPSYEVEKASGGTISTEEQHIRVTAPAPTPPAQAPPANLAAMDLGRKPEPVAPPPAPASPASAPPMAMPSPPAAAPPPKAVPGYVPSLLQMNDAQRQAKVAVSSLGFQDYKSAIDYLHKALKLLTSPQ